MSSSAWDWTAAGYGMGLLLVLLIQVSWLSFILARRMGRTHLAPGILKCALGLSVFVLAEGLSLAHRLEPTWTRAAWSLLALAAGVLVVRLKPGVEWRQLSLGLGSMRPAELSVAAIFFATLVTAVAAPPNTWDAITYHNPRSLQWLDHQSVAPYATPIDRQIRMPPLASYMRLHLFALTGTDWLFNLPQWLFFALTVLEIGLWVGSRTAGVGVGLGALVVASQPMAILQSSSSQNDLIAGGYFVSAALLLQRAHRESALGAALLGLCVGLCALTKGTGYLLGATCAATLVLGVFRGGGRVPHTLAALILALLLNLPHVWRVYSWSGTPLPHYEMASVQVLTSPLGLVLQLQRNVLLQLDVVEGILNAATGAFEGAGPSTDENRAGNTLFFALALAVTASELRRPGPHRAERRSLLVLGWLSFTALALGIRSMPWNTRLHTPALLVLAIPVALWLEERCRGSRVRHGLVAAALFLSSLPYVAWNSSRPLLPFEDRPSLFELSRWENLFRSQPNLREAVEEVMAEMPPECSRRTPVRLEIGPDDGEYLLWAGSLRAGRDVSFRHPDPGDPRPICGVIRSRCDAATPLCWLPADGGLAARP